MAAASCLSDSRKNCHGWREIQVHVLSGEITLQKRPLKTISVWTVGVHFRPWPELVVNTIFIQSWIIPQTSTATALEKSLGWQRIQGRVQSLRGSSFKTWLRNPTPSLTHPLSKLKGAFQIFPLHADFSPLSLELRKWKPNCKGMQACWTQRHNLGFKITLRRSQKKTLIPARVAWEVVSSHKSSLNLPSLSMIKLNDKKLTNATGVLQLPGDSYELVGT